MESDVKTTKVLADLSVISVNQICPKSMLYDSLRKLMVRTLVTEPLTTSPTSLYQSDCNCQPKPCLSGLYSRTQRASFAPFHEKPFPLSLFTSAIVMTG